MKKPRDSGVVCISEKDFGSSNTLGPYVRDGVLVLLPHLFQGDHPGIQESTMLHKDKVGVQTWINHIKITSGIRERQLSTC